MDQEHPGRIPTQPVPGARQRAAYVEFDAHSGREGLDGNPEGSLAAFELRRFDQRDLRNEERDP